MKDFVALPRKIKYGYLDGQLSRTAMDILIWIFLNTNPVNGRCETSYAEMAADRGINEQYARKLLSTLRRLKYVWFETHYGRGGKFTIRPSDFLLSNKSVQQWENCEFTTSDKVLDAELSKDVYQASHNYASRFHNTTNENEPTQKALSRNQKQPQFTAANNDTDTNNDTDVTRKLSLDGLETLRATVKKLDLSS